MRAKKFEKKSPLKAPPLRYPGQSLDEEIRRVLEDDVLTYLLMAAMACILAMLEWFRWFLKLPPNPIVYTAIALIVSGITAIKLIRVIRKVRNLKLARDGEKAVGQYLDSLRDRGYQIFHDLIGNKFNIDHVLIGPAGVFTVETKTISKPAKGSAEVEYDGERIKVGGFVPDRDPVVQGKAQAGWLRELLQETTGRRYEVRAMVVYPGWFVKAANRSGRFDVLVLNPKVIPSLLEKSEIRLAPEDIKLLAYHLSRHIRTAA